MAEGNESPEAARLTLAVRAGDVDAARSLLETHPSLRTDLNRPMHDAHFGGTALLAAVRTGNRQMAELLLAAGADIDQRSHWWAGGFGVLDGESPLIDWLVAKGATVDACAAARHGWLDRLRALVTADPAAVRMRGGDGQTPLHVARSVEIARFLLDHGADIDALDVDHESTPAMYLIREHPGISRFLVDRGCRTDILLAAALGDLELVKQHLARNPAAIRTAVTPEYFPMRHPRAGGTIYIWTLGAGTLPHIVAHRAGHSAVFECLMAASPPALQLAMAAETGDEARARRILATAPDLIAGFTAAERRRLAVAATDNRTDAVALMLALGWPTDTPGQEGGTALHWAAFHGNAAMVATLLARQPNLAIRDGSHDGTALGWALHGKEHGWEKDRGNYPETIRLLTEAGCRE